MLPVLLLLKTQHTPCTQARFEHELGDRRIKNSNEEKVHIDPFHQHPGHGGEEEVVDEKADDHAQRGRMTSIDAEDEDEIEAEESETEVDHDFLRLSGMQLPAENK